MTGRSTWGASIMGNHRRGQGSTWIWFWIVMFFVTIFCGLKFIASHHM